MVGDAQNGCHATLLIQYFIALIGVVFLLNVIPRILLTKMYIVKMPTFITTNQPPLFKILQKSEVAIPKQ